MTTQASQRTPQIQILNLSTSPAVLGPLHVLLLDIEISLGPGLAFPPWLLGAPLSVQRPPPHYLSLPISGLLLCQICSSAFGRAGQSHCQPQNMQWAAPSSPILASISVAVTNASSSLLWLKTQPGRQEGLAGQGCGNGPWETGDKTRCHLGHARDIPPLGGLTAESGLSQVLALLTTKLHGATQMSWLWEVKHTSCPLLATRLHARTRESARPYDRVQEPQILGLREAGAGGHE